jgi:hypothetical protein
MEVKVTVVVVVCWGKKHALPSSPFSSHTVCASVLWRRLPGFAVTYAKSLLP